MKIRRGDEVLVLVGKNRGKRGKVLRSLPRENRVVVEGVNIVKRHTKPQGALAPAGIIEREAPIHISNVMLICTKCQQPTRVGFQSLEGKGNIRVCKRCHKGID
jgi:large subunit ribosomal protein L24